MERFKLPIINFLTYLFGTLLLNTIIINLFKNIHNPIMINLINLIPSLIILTLLIIINKDNIINNYKNIKTNYSNNIKKTIKYYFLGLFFMILSNNIIQLFTKSLPLNEIENRKIIKELPLYSIISMIIIVPLIEEIVFRGSFKNTFKNKNTFLFVTAFIFGLFHVLFMGDFIYIIPYSVFGYFLSKIYYETNNIFYSYLAHAIHNTICLLLIFLGGN